MSSLASAAEYMIRCEQFADGTLQSCPLCDEQVEKIVLYEKSEPQLYSLYIRPCNHRLGLWEGAPKWARDRGIVETVPLEY